MKIYAFAEVYPSPYKGYLDAQFAQFVRDGHDLRVFSFNSHEHRSSDDAPDASPAQPTTRLPGTLRSIPASTLAAARNVAVAPRESCRRLAIAVAADEGLKAKLATIARTLCLPIESPDVCIVHSLLALRHLTLLKQIYPQARIAFYYHGGELPGVPTLSQEDALRAFASADVVFTNTRDSLAHAVSRGCAADKIRVSPVGFNLAEFPLTHPKRYRRGGLLRVLTTGRLSAEKGHIYALHAIEDVLASGVEIEYRIVGDGPEEPALRTFIREHGLGQCVTLQGRVSRAQLWQEYVSADVFLLPSVAVGTWQENQACVVQEAMLAECIPCVSITGGVPESTLPSALDYAFEPGNPAQIAASLRRMASLAEHELTALGRAAREFVTDRYDIAALNRQVLGQSTGNSAEMTSNATAKAPN